jgi:hypothetical protein
MRFSTVAGEKGSADAARDPRGFAMRFYTEDGNYDIVGNNTPVFFLRDGMKFPDFIHSQKREPRTNLKNPTAVGLLLAVAGVDAPGNDPLLGSGHATDVSPHERLRQPHV